MAALTACSTVADLPSERLASATLSLSNGVPAGTVQVVTNGDTVTLVAAVSGIAPGPHGFHLHTTGNCARPDFTSAGGHLNPLGKHHGSLSEGGRHVGDLPNIEINSGGTGSLTADLPGTRADISRWLFDADGTAVVVHADADDYRTDPSGNAGSRIACGVLKPA
ncbi:superoxide dismutase family protein [Tsuneonella sp. YG55]|uniref:Superoxide dismutase family protein n=1 Tax=Tsuneonella litorea TaxID=2976475 RepID=A0A9X3A6S8_9SPHN|nr:superoxide dismutase family protein [Tsuneonella litorea]MCT2557656.1 superoxide dismutase family protein [Tsuneonella litorea]